MKITILLPHYKTGEMSAYSLYELLKMKGRHDIEIIVINNSPEDDSIKHIRPILRNSRGVSTTIISSPKGRLQSHGIAFDLVLPIVTTEYFVTVESDSFPTNDTWLDGYESLTKQGCDVAGSVLKLSGGTYLHPCGALYKTSNWHDAHKYCKTIPYTYFPNIAMKDDFPCHLMVHREILADFIVSPGDFGVILHSSYHGLSPRQILEKAEDYKPVTGPFHNGMGTSQESYYTYAQRNMTEEPARILFSSSNESIIYRMGFEPGQWFSYWLLGTGKKAFILSTEVKWMPGRENQQQEYTLMSNGFKHLWGVTSYSQTNRADNPGLDDIITRKRGAIKELYETLPENLKLT